MMRRVSLLWLSYVGTLILNVLLCETQPLLFCHCHCHSCRPPQARSIEHAYHGLLMKISKITRTHIHKVRTLGNLASNSFDICCEPLLLLSPEPKSGRHELSFKVNTPSLRWISSDPLGRPRENQILTCYPWHCLPRSHIIIGCPSPESSPRNHGPKPIRLPWCQTPSVKHTEESECISTPSSGSS